MRIIIFIAFCAILSSCNQKENNTTVDSNTQEIDEIKTQNLKTFELGFGFIISAGQEEDFNDFKTFSFLRLTRNNEIIYTDSLTTEYEFGNKLFPLVVKTGENDFELLLEINNRPNKNYLKRFFIQEDKLIGEDKLPAFESKAIDIDNDGIKEYAGYWDYAQTWGENYELTAYNPIIYYTQTNSGFEVDSTLTENRNEKIYGKFYGFEFNENLVQPKKVLENFDNEIKLITNKDE
jgi:hypothetical protein